MNRTSRIPHATSAVSRPGVALMITLIAVALAFVIGMTVLAGLPSASRASSNLLDRQAAVYLAESGLQEAIARMNQPPSGQSVWTGVTGRSVSGLSGTYDVTVNELDDGTYRIDSTGHAAGIGGVTVDHALHMTVSIQTQQGGYVMPAATVLGNGGFLASGINFNGDVSVIGTVFNLATINGDLTASGNIFNLGSVSGSVHANSSVDAPPNLDLNQINQYVYNGQICQAQIVQPNDVRYLDRNLSPVSQSNPLGVIVVAGDMTLRNDINLSKGMLVVRGDLNLGSYDLQINQSQENYFSLMVGGDIRYQSYSQVIVNSGPAYVKGTFSGSGYNSSFVFNSGLVTLQSLPLIFSGSMQINKPASQQPNSHSNSHAWDHWPWGGGHQQEDDEPLTINLLTSGGNGGAAGTSGRTVSLLSYSASAQP